MTNRTTEHLHFGRMGRRHIETNFQGGDLMQRLRELALKGTELERASAATIGVRLLKIEAAIVHNARRRKPRCTRPRDRARLAAML